MKKYKNFKITEILENYKKSGSVRFHMPGHSGRSVSSVLDKIYPYDVTELPFTDDLHEPNCDGAFAEIESYIKKITSAKDVIISCSGSTSMIQTAVTAAVRRKRAKILCERKVHLSVVHAIALNQAEVEWMIDVESELSEKITGNEACVIITSPDYYGKIHDVEKISGICKKYNVPLITDSAHGAHLEFFRNGESSVFRKGAALSAESLHKTLPALTGSAILLSDGTFTKQELLFARRKFSSSSPSYITSLSIAECMKFMDTFGNEKLESLYENVAYTKKSLSEIGFEFDENKFSDPFRIYIKTGNLISPSELNKVLADEKIICEFYDSQGLVLIPSLLHERCDFDRLISACKSALKDKKSYINFKKNIPDHLPKVRMNMGEAFLLLFETIRIEDALNCVCAEPVYLYPPGVPVVMPGEIFDESYVEYLKKIGINSVSTVDFQCVSERKY